VAARVGRTYVVNVHRDLVRKPERGCLENLSLKKDNIKNNLNKSHGRQFTGNIWFKTGKSDGLL
jgi:hypothetical protein